jgi:hypothetical protein
MLIVETMIERLTISPLLRSESGVVTCNHSFLSPRLFVLLLGPIWSNSGLFCSESGQMDSERRRGSRSLEASAQNYCRDDDREIDKQVLGSFCSELRSTNKVCYTGSVNCFWYRPLYIMYVCIYTYIYIVIDSCLMIDSWTFVLGITTSTGTLCVEQTHVFSYYYQNFYSIFRQ